MITVTENTANDVGSLSQDQQRENIGAFSKEPMVRRFVFEDSEEETSNRVVVDLKNLLDFNTEALRALKLKAKSDKKVLERRDDQLKKGVRESRLYNEGVRIGAQTALSSTINGFVSGVYSHSDSLFANYNFKLLMLNGGTVAPPVINLSQEVVTTDDNNFTKVDSKYHIVSQAKFVDKPVSFFDYMVFENYDVKEPLIFNIPLSENELNYWKNGVYAGWIAGARQARFQIDSAINKLNRDYLGMLRYHVMSLENMISAPIISKRTIDAKVSGDSMDVGKVSLRISTNTKFNKESLNWDALPRIDRLERDLLFKK